MEDSCQYRNRRRENKTCIPTIKWFLVLSVVTYNFGVHAKVRPRLLLPNGTNIDGYERLYIPYGNSIDLFCTGQANRELLMAKNSDMIKTWIVNETTVRFFDKHPHLGRSHVNCGYIEDFDRSYVNVNINIVVDTIPVVKNFSCISKIEYMNCSWTSTPGPLKTVHKLYYENDGVISQLCGSKKYHKSMQCIWDMKSSLVDDEILFEKLTFFMMSCNDMGCGNQTFELNHRSIIKLDPPKDLIISEIRSHGAILKWDISTIPDYLNFEVEYKITYWYSGIDPLPYNITDTRYLLNSLTLNLPCAETFYEIRISVKSRAAADDFWSDDAVISFVTESETENKDSADDPTCSHQRVNITPEVMLYKIDELRKTVIEEQKALKEMINSMQWKSAKNNLK